MDLSTLANLSEIVGAAIVIAGFAFGFAQLQQYRLQRRAAAAIGLADQVGSDHLDRGGAFQNAQLARALRLVLSLPSNVDASELRERGSEYEDAAMLVSLTVESVGLMVHRRMVSLEMVWELMGGVLLRAWDRLEGWTEVIRQEQASEKFNEWMQWLAEQLERRYASLELEPVYRRYASWLPRQQDRVA